MNKEFETWWITNKFRLMENDDVGVREIALAAYEAGKEASEQRVQRIGCTCPIINDHTMGINPLCVVHGELANR